MHYKKILCSILISGTLLCQGCAKIESADPKDGYSTNYAMTAVEYSIFLNKQIGVVENVLMTRMLIAGNVGDGKYGLQNEINSTEESIEKTGEAIDEVTVMMPATGYETDRQNVLDLMEDARLVLEDYLKTLNSGGTDIQEHIDQMEACYVALSGEANSYYK